jgi:hypothetical protein
LQAANDAISTHSTVILIVYVVNTRSSIKRTASSWILRDLRGEAIGAGSAYLVHDALPNCADTASRRAVAPPMTQRPMPMYIAERTTRHTPTNA